jgi:hypothetical protein
MSKYNKKINIQSDEFNLELEKETKKQIKKTTKSSNSDSSNDKKSAKKMSSSDSGSDDNEDKPVGKLGKKDFKNLEKQKEIFEELKELLGMTNEKPSFTSFKADEVRTIIIEDMFPEIVKAFNYKIWNSRSDTDKYRHMALIRKIFKYYGYQICYTATTKKVKNEVIKGKKYYAVKIN